MSKVALLSELVTVPSCNANKLLNLASSALFGACIRIVWSDIEIIDVSRIRFGQRFLDGHDHLLEAIGFNARLVIKFNVNFQAAFIFTRSIMCESD